MKHTRILFILAAVLMTACASKEKKAERLISDYFYTTLYDFDSYQPIETTVDETSMTPFLDEDCRSTAKIGVTARGMHQEAMDSFNDAFSSMKIWGGSWDSYSRKKYQEAKEDVTRQYESAKKYLILSFDMMLELKDLADSLSNVKAPAGWAVTHKYRVKSKGGYSLLCSDVFFIDPKFKEVLLHIEGDDEDEHELQDFIMEAVTSERDSILANKAKVAGLSVQ